MRAKTIMSAMPILLLSLAFSFFSVRGDAQTKLPIAVVPNVGDLSDIDHAVFSPNGQLLATTDTIGFANSITLWDIASARPLRTLEYYAYFTTFLFTPDGTLIASAHKDGSIKFWDVETGSIIATLKEALEPGHSGDPDVVRSLSIDDNGEFHVSGTGAGVIAVWNMAQRKRIYRFKLAPLDNIGNYPHIVAAQLSRDRSKLTVISRASVNDMDSVRVFDLSTGRISSSFTLGKNYSFAEDGIVG